MRVTKVMKKTTAAVEGAPKQKSNTAAKDGYNGGIKTGLKPKPFWRKILVANEKAKKSEKLTDKQISQAVADEFPVRGEESEKFLIVADHRWAYNAGKYEEDGQAPALKSQRYTEAGELFVSSRPTKVSGTKKERLGRAMERFAAKRKLHAEKIGKAQEKLDALTKADDEAHEAFKAKWAEVEGYDELVVEHFPDAEVEDGEAAAPPAAPSKTLKKIGK